MPNYAFESEFAGDVAGIDEAGRGPLAGPVVAAAVILNPENIPLGLNDSKVLSLKERERLLNVIIDTSCVGIGIAEPHDIDRANILWASMIAMQRAFYALPQGADGALIDGNRCPELSCQTQAIIKGDSKSLSIAAASIIAKVTRDRLMILADKTYPQYGFARHKGYPTKMHREALMDHGPCPIHRYSYKPVQIAALRHNI